MRIRRHSCARLWLLIIVTRPPGAIVTLDGETRPSVPIVIVAVVGFGPAGGGVGVGSGGRRALVSPACCCRRCTRLP
jgi:hypothetical protein